MTLTELLVVLAILGVVVGALVQLLVSATRAEVDMSTRFRAQQEGRLALEGLRREIHCASAVVLNGGVSTSSSITITLDGYCPTNTAVATGSPPVKPSQSVTWCTIGGSAPYALWRVEGAVCTTANPSLNPVKKADYLTSSQAFGPYTLPGGGLRAKLSVDLPVDLTPLTTSGLYRLKDDIVLRNTARS